ncbi:MAG: methyltransferase domain-containing protein [Gemmatimonadetes bacterium]|nr:methyltransferase domain-containing protein [Gemmatimonadota bacterium]
MTTLRPAEAYALWAPRYAAETVISALEYVAVESLGVELRGRRLLDVGCGIARRLTQARESGVALAVGVDLTPRMLAEAREGELLAAADVRAIPVADAAFDVVWCRLVLGHLSDLDAAYAELARVCARGGRVVVTDFHPDAVAAGHRRTFRDAEGVVQEIEHHVHTPRAHRRAAARAGLTLVQRFDRVVGETVRGFYERADRLDVYEQQRGLAVVLGLAFVRA